MPKRSYPLTARSMEEEGQFVAAGVQEKPVSPFSQALRGVVVGSETFIARVRAMLSDREADPAVPEFGELGSKPSLERIREAVAEEFGVDVTAWTKGRRWFAHWQNSTRVGKTAH